VGRWSGAAAADVGPDAGRVVAVQTLQSARAADLLPVGLIVLMSGRINSPI
jgi:hypothetical protein